MTTQDAKLKLQRTICSRRPVAVCFTKRDGTLRTMRCRYEGHRIRRGGVVVRDLDLGELRTVPLGRVHYACSASDTAYAESMEEIASYFG